MVKTIIIILLVGALIWIKRKAILYRSKKITSHFRPSKQEVLSAPPKKYHDLSETQESAIRNAIKFTFTGDLILLKDMVEYGYDDESKSYKFDDMFKYVKEYYDEADFNIGVFEGPVAGAEKGFSTSNFNDGIPIYLNYPVEYAEAVKRAGFNLVTLANNHMLDQGVDGLYHTMDELERIHLPFMGAYKDEKAKSSIHCQTIKGKKIVFLPYTYGSNHIKTDFFFEEANRHLTKIIVPPKSKYFNECLESVKKDFEQAKQLSPDLIVVLPHMGKQFRHAPDDFQKYWCNVFIENGADIILSDHPHAVQPIEWCKRGGKNVLIVHCPGNFINSYILRDGDASMIVEVYLNKDTGKPIGASCIPIYAYCKYDKENKSNYVGLPIYKIFNDDNLDIGFGRYEYKRIVEVQKLVTKTALGMEIGIDNLHSRYYSLADQ